MSMLLTSHALALVDRFVDRTTNPRGWTGKSTRRDRNGGLSAPKPATRVGRTLPYSPGSANTTSRSFPRGSPLAGAETLAATYCRPSFPA